MKKLLFLSLLLFPQNLLAHGAEHQKIFHSFTLEADAGDASRFWDLDGWIGSDENKLVLKSEGKFVNGEAHEADIQALYSKNISEFWDAQFGVRHDFETESENYLSLGFEGLAPYFLETEIHAFLDSDGDLSLRLKQETDILLTQKLIFQPFYELNAKKDWELEFGAKMRYEITKKFAPYFALRYFREDSEDDFVASVGLRLKF